MREQPKKGLRASTIARRRAEEKRADTLHRRTHPYAPPMELRPLATS